MGSPVRPCCPERLAGRVGGIVGNKQIAAAQQFQETGPRQVPGASPAVDCEEPRLGRSRDRQRRGYHWTASCAIRSYLMDASSVPIAVTSPLAAVSGRLSLDRSASGTAIACKGGVHVARVERHHGDPSRAEFFVPDPAQMMQRSLAGTIGTPTGIGVDRSITRNVQNHGSAALPRRGCECAQDPDVKSSEQPDVPGSGGCLRALLLVRALP